MLKVQKYKSNPNFPPCICDLIFLPGYLKDYLFLKFMNCILFLSDDLPGSCFSSILWVIVAYSFKFCFSIAVLDYVTMVFSLCCICH